MNSDSGLVAILKSYALSPSHISLAARCINGIATGIIKIKNNPANELMLPYIEITKSYSKKAIESGISTVTSFNPTTASLGAILESTPKK